MAKPTPINKEAAFNIHELFFSWTDKKGLILAGNDVFIRISGYSLSELINKPHNMIRHPDMPKAVFKLFWETVSQDKPIVAYVKNMAADGSFYWVVAMAFPVESGYISIRLKPSSSLFELIPSLYQKMLSEERVKGVDASTGILVSALTSLGFSSYEDFMKKVLIEELKARDLALSKLAPTERLTLKTSELLNKLSAAGDQCSHEASSVFKTMLELVGIAEEFSTESDSMLKSCQGLNFLSINMACESEKAGTLGRTLSVVSEQFRVWSQDIGKNVNDFKNTMEEFMTETSETEFLVSVSKFQLEMIRFFFSQYLNQLNSGSSPTDQERETLRKNASALYELATVNLSRVSASLLKLNSTFSRLQTTKNDLLQSLTALEIIRLTGRVETSRLSEIESSFETHLQTMLKALEQARIHTVSLDEKYKNMSFSFKEIQGRVENLQRDFSTLHRVNSM